VKSVDGHGEFWVCLHGAPPRWPKHIRVVLFEGSRYTDEHPFGKNKNPPKKKYIFGFPWTVIFGFVGMGLSTQMRRSMHSVAAGKACSDGKLKVQYLDLLVLGEIIIWNEKVMMYNCWDAQIFFFFYEQSLGKLATSANNLKVPHTLSHHLSYHAVPTDFIVASRRQTRFRMVVFLFFFPFLPFLRHLSSSIFNDCPPARHGANNRAYPGPGSEGIEISSGGPFLTCQ
jgi:hypothetical protein